MERNFLSIENNRLKLIINLRGGGISQFFEKSPEKKHLIYGYDTTEKQDGCMGDILFPWTGRVENRQYTFHKKKYKLVDEDNKNPYALHGLVKNQNFTLLKRTKNSVKLELKLKASKFKAKGYPFGAVISVVYTLLNNGFSVYTAVTNNGEETLPFGLGFHPYFCLDVDKIDDLYLEIPAKSLIEFDSNLKPTGKIINIEKSDFDYSKLKLIGNQQIDNCFTGLNYKNNEAITTLKNLKTNHQIRIIQDKNMPYIQVYSSDTIKKENYRKGIAIEPQTCCGYALNIPELGLRELGPKKQFICQWRVEVK
jgi:aldose 1-epimerase